MTTEPEPRRLTPSERQHEVLMALAQRAPSPPEHSVEITRNAKGVAQFEVTVRGYDLEAVLQSALNVYGDLAKELPYPENDS